MLRPGVATRFGGLQPGEFRALGFQLKGAGRLNLNCLCRRPAPALLILIVPREPLVRPVSNSR